MLAVRAACIAPARRRCCCGVQQSCRGQYSLAPRALAKYRGPSAPAFLVSSQTRPCSTSSSSTNNGPPGATAATTTFDWQALEAERKEWLRDPQVIADLRSDHSGETGAVYIYRGAAWAMARMPSRHSAAARAFVAEHHATEQAHLDLLTRLLPAEHRSGLLPAWRAAGWALGAAPALASEAALFATVEAVEAFVERHYDEHIVPMRARGAYPELVRLLQRCRDDEVHHKHDAAARCWGVTTAAATTAATISGSDTSSVGSASDVSSSRPWYARAWAAVVVGGSKAAVAVCRRI